MKTKRTKTNPDYPRPLWRAVAIALSLASTSPALRAQAIDKTSTDDVDTNEVLQLSPFEVSSTQDKGYAASSSLAGSRLNTDLRDIAAAVQVITPEFMQDLGATDLKKLLLYTTNTEVAGIDGNFYGGDTWDKGYTRNLLVEPQNTTRIRGLNTADITRDFFPTDVPIDWYSLSRVDISRGPNSMLFGLGSPAGLINNTLKVPGLAKNAYSAELKVSSYGSHREVVDIDQAIIPGQLGVRLVALNDEARFRQDFTFNDDRRIYAAARWQPKLGSRIFTQIDVNGEWAKIKGNRPVAGTPADFISNWYGPANRILVANDQYWDNPPAFGAIENIYASQTLGGQLWDDHPVSFFSSPTGGDVGLPGNPQAMLARGWSNVLGGGWGSWVGLLNPNWEINNPNHEKNRVSYYANNPTVAGIISDYEAQTGRSFRGFGQGMWPAQMIVDGPLADLMTGQNLIGPNKREFNNFETFNIGVTQSYLDGRFGWNFAYNEQRYRSGYTNLMEGLWGNNVISIDINQALRNSETPNNPNVGRPYTFGEGRGGIYEKERENWRFTGFARLEAEDFLRPDSWLAKILGEHTFTGVAANQRYENFDRNFALYRWDQEYGQALGWNNPGYATWRGIHYLGDSVLGTNSMDDLTGITGVRTLHAPPLNQSVLAVSRESGQTVWGQRNYNLISSEDNINRLYDGASQGYDTTDSRIFVWQGNLLNGVLVPIFGWREDEYERWNKPGSLARDPTYNFVLPYSDDWNYDSVTPVYAKEQRRSWSLALHGKELMEMIGRPLPAGMDITLLYNDSSSFRPSDVARDVYANQEANPSGETRDVSVLVSAFHDRLSLRVTKYKTIQKNTPFIGATPPFNRNKSILGRSMNGMMWEIAPQWGSAPAADRHQPTPEWLVNNWMFGEGNYDTAIANQPLPSNWRDVPGILNQPLRIRHAAVPGDPSYVAQGAINPTLNLPYVAPPLNEEEIAYRSEWYRARSQAEWSRPVDQEWWNAVGFEPNWTNPWGGPWEVTAWQVPPNSRSLNDLESTGVEYEVVANPTPNWRITFNAARAEAVRSNVLNSWDEYVEKNMPFWFDGDYSLNDVPAMNYWSFRGFYDIPESPGSTLGTGGRLGTGYGSEILGPYYQAKATEERLVNELRKWHFNLVSNYRFTSGSLKGLGVGGAFRWMDKATIGYYPRYNADANAWVNDLSKPITSPSEKYYDAWVSYERDFGDKLTWSVQLNVYNLFADDRMIATQANPDGTIAQVRIPSQTTWALTNTFKF